MKRIFLLGLMLILALSAATMADQPIRTKVEMQDVPGFIGFVPDEIVVNFDQFTTANMDKSANVNGRVGIYEIDRLADRFSVVSVRAQFPGAANKGRSADLSGWHKIKFAADVDVEQAVKEYKQLANVIDAQPIGIHSMYAMPNDGNFAEQWHLNQANDHDIDAPEAWDIETGDEGVIVAILDSGVRYFHKDLGGSNASYNNPTAVDGNMWINWAEKNGSSGVDDDGNGFVWMTGSAGILSMADRIAGPVRIAARRTMILATSTAMAPTARAMWQLLPTMAMEPVALPVAGAMAHYSRAATA